MITQKPNPAIAEGRKRCVPTLLQIDHLSLLRRVAHALRSALQRCGDVAHHVVEGPPARADSERQPNRLPFGQTDHDYHLLFDVSGPVWPNFQGGSTWINSPFGRRVGGPLGTVGARETPAEPPIISLTKNIFSCESKGLF